VKVKQKIKNCKKIELPFFFFLLFFLFLRPFFLLFHLFTSLDAH
jgi:hypothetical protein